jgi:translation initiation factor 2 alpha subunit (eIF-2alpha)
MLEVGDLVLCTVDKIVGTVVFVKIDENGDGSIVTSEIAPGRIRNLRDYVVPKKRIVCKVLRINQGNIELSLRRVTMKEKKEVMEQDAQEKSYKGIIKGILKDKAEEVINKIIEKEKIFNFLQEAKQSPELLKNYFNEKDAEKILEILNSQKQKKKEVKKEVHLTTTKSDGIELIKEILKNIKNAEVKYISAGRYSIKTESTNPKAADNQLREILVYVEKEAKRKGVEYNQ